MLNRLQVSCMPSIVCRKSYAESTTNILQVAFVGNATITLVLDW